jgi:hypothetical protein
MKKSMIATALIRLLIWVGANTAQAASINTVTGKLWHVLSDSTYATPENVPATTPDVIFQVNSPINFFAQDPTTVGNWLGSGSAFNIIENTPGTLASNMSASLIEFRGFVSVTHGQTFAVGHDDGLTLIIGATDMGFNPAPTKVGTVATYLGPSGNFEFQMIYVECCMGEAFLRVDLPFTSAPVPEPETYALFMAGLGLMGFIARRRKNSQA